jgi:subtilisin-like proprotein convertase family protein
MKKKILIFLFFYLVLAFSPAFSGEDIFKIKLEVTTEKELFFLKEIGLDCPDKGECICEANISQLNHLRTAHYPYTPLKQGIRIEKERIERGTKVPSPDSIVGSNGTNYYIHGFDTTYSNISVTGAPSGATVEEIEVRYDIIHTYVGDLVVDLTDQAVSCVYNLWDREGDGQDNIHDTVSNIDYFNGEPVNQTWRLRVYDASYGDTGYIDYWSITIWYQGPADLIVQSLIPSNYNPMVGEAIDVTMVIKNQGQTTAQGYFWNDLFFNEPSPPVPPASGDLYWSTSSLDPGQTESHTFTGITSSVAETWYMYGLTDSWDHKLGRLRFPYQLPLRSRTSSS